MSFARPLRIAAAVSLALAFGAPVACGTDQDPPDDGLASPVDAGRPKKDASTSTDPDVEEPSDDASAPTDGGSDAAIDSGKPWPTCDAKPSGVVAKTIPEIWTANPATETETWISGAYVTAISGGACTANKACQVFLQADPSYPTLASAAKHAIKMFVSGPVAAKFTALAVGDRVDALGHAWRYKRDGQNELLLQVNLALPGCAKAISTKNALSPIPNVRLGDLTLDAYENTHGPLLVKVDEVSGKPDATATTTFGLWHTTDGGGFDGGSASNIVSLSPVFLPGAAFTGLSNTVTRFASVTGVFGLFVPAGGPKYLEIYPRTSADIVTK